MQRRRCESMMWIGLREVLVVVQESRVLTLTITLIVCAASE